MKPVFEQTPRRQWESFHCEIVRGPGYGATWHFHPEFQITLVLKSTGYRLVGDNITPLAPGDLVLVGANLPHVWQQDAGGGRGAVHAIVVRFLDTSLGRDFLEIPEAAGVKRLLRRAARGLRVTGRTRDAVAERLSARLAKIVVGDPSVDGVKMGALASHAQLVDVGERVALLARSAEVVFGNRPVAPVGEGTQGGAFF